MAMQQRQTAYKVWISDLLKNKYVIQSGEWEPNYIEINGKNVSRVNIIGNIIDKYDTDLVSSAVIDDGSSSIPARCFNENIKILKDIMIGDLVLIVGKPRENNNKERFIVCEIAKKLDNPKWTELRKLELEKSGHKLIKDEIAADENKEAEDINKTHDKSRAILDLIRGIDDGNGANIDEVINKSGIDDDEARKTIKKLLEQGEIYENRPNRLKTIE